MAAKPSSLNQDSWPELPLEAWQDTYATLHMWTQIVGKVRLALSPRINHWWEVALYVNARGLTTSAIPYDGKVFDVQFDFIDHKLIIQTSWGSSKTLALKPQSVADFYAAFMSALQSLGIEVKIWTMPCEVPNPVRFDADTQHASYDPEYAHRFWQDIGLVREHLPGIPRRLHRQGQSGAFLLGKLRSLCDALLRAARPGAGGSRSGHARSLFA